MLQNQKPLSEMTKLECQIAAKKFRNMANRFGLTPKTKEPVKAAKTALKFAVHFERAANDGRT